MRITRLLIGIVVTIALVGAAPQAGGADAPGAVETDPTATVGALYVPSVLGLGPIVGLPHECTASVVHSTTHDLLLTAAHCVAGTGVGYEFAPAYALGALPYGTWTVTRVYVNRAWAAHRDPQHDYAFLRVARRSWHGATRAIEDVVGGNALGSAPPPGTSVTVIGYVAGSNDRPLSCTTPTSLEDGFPAFDCDGF
ncbi:MAG TPA: trypsin-like peptidase domain-containing protein, partial [Jatrophihabitantaceae bacterium]|nr:trypsin-like peptidase domain-containing protein [Jatrophihabitantaceae bacterium]